VHRFAAAHGLTVIFQFTDVETGKGADALDQRQELGKALREAKRLDCKIVVAKPDRLSRDVHFISGLMAERVPFVVSELGPDVDPFMLHIYAAVAQKEAALISQRTKSALKAAKRRGVRRTTATTIASAGRTSTSLRSMATACSASARGRRYRSSPHP
jgi:DNA invertase Pin-like site-specific DNA recombinase